MSVSALLTMMAVFAEEMTHVCVRCGTDFGPGFDAALNLSVHMGDCEKTCAGCEKGLPIREVDTDILPLGEDNSFHYNPKTGRLVSKHK